MGKYFPKLSENYLFCAAPPRSTIRSMPGVLTANGTTLMTATSMLDFIAARPYEFQGRTLKKKARKVFLRRIAGLPGDVLNLESGQYTVPHGTIFVLCESSKDGRCRDSRDFGPVPLRDVIGKVRQVIYSYEDEGMRWDRVGLTFDKLSQREK